MMKSKFKDWLLLRGSSDNTLKDAFNGGYRRAIEDVGAAVAFMNVDAHPLYLMRDYKRANRHP